jgi:hypothetical protein
MARGDAVQETLLEVKRRISDAVLDLNGVSGVGVRGESVVVYLESDDARSSNGSRDGLRLAPACRRLRSLQPLRETVAQGAQGAMGAQEGA